jgi:hypothetical protein
MSEKKIQNVVIAVLAVIGAVVFLALLGMWLMHVTMGGMMGDGMGAMVGSMGRRSLFILLLIVAVIILAVALARRGSR